MFFFLFLVNWWMSYKQRSTEGLMNVLFAFSEIIKIKKKHFDFYNIESLQCLFTCKGIKELSI